MNQVARRRLAGVHIGAACALTAAHGLRVFESWLSDDAFIFFRYTRNLMRGDGLSWNPGEGPIEGFTSLTQVLLLAVAEGLGVDLILASQVLGVFFAIVSCLGAAGLAWYASGRDTRAAVFAAYTIALSPQLAVWSRSGMETTVFTALLALAMIGWMWESERGDSRVFSAVLFFVATVTRPEGLGVWGLTVAADAWRQLPRAAAVVRTALRWWPYVFLVSVYLMVKQLYFGSILPNTYYVKSGGGLWALQEGVLYVLRFARDVGPVALVLAVVPLIRSGAGDLPRLIYLAICAAAYASQVARVGGDYHPLSRYLAPTLPMLCALIGAGAVALWDARSRLPRALRVAAALAIVVLGGAQLLLPSLREVQSRPWLLTRPLRWVDQDRVDSGTLVQVGRSLDLIVSPGQTVATTAVGAIGYYCDRPILDMLGLNDAAIARAEVERERYVQWIPGHMKGDAQEVLQRRPDFVLLSLHPTITPATADLESVQRNFPFMRDLVESPEFATTYEAEALRLGRGGWITIYRRSRP